MSASRPSQSQLIVGNKLDADIWIERRKFLELLGQPHTAERFCAGDTNRADELAACIKRGTRNLVGVPAHAPGSIKNALSCIRQFEMSGAADKELNPQILLKRS